MTSTISSTTPAGILAATEALAPTITARAAEVEAARRLPDDLLTELVGAGCFRLLLPPSHHGAGADLPSALRVIEALSRADASVGWTVMIGGSIWADLVELPRATFDELFSRPDVIGAGVFSPSGQITRAGDGYEVNGRWAFASGCEHADWIYGNCVEGVLDGVPQLRTAVFTPDQVTIEDTWHTSGLRGTGSHHFSAADVQVPAERTAVPLAGEPCIDEPIVRVPIPSLFALEVATVAVGVAQGALDDVTALASGKVPLLSGGTLAANPRFQYELAEADTARRAARGLIDDTAAALWERAITRTPVPLAEVARARAAAAWATMRAAEVVDAAYQAGGGTSLYAESPLQRRLRDVHAITQHFLVKPDTLTTAGTVLAGGELTVPIF